MSVALAAAVTPRVIEIRPQAGSQEAFLSTPADIAVYGGAAGSGKTFALLLEALRHIHNPEFGAVIFRRTYPQITNEGGLWDTAAEIYPTCGGVARFSTLEYVFPSGAKVKFAHMQHETDRFAWDGSQITLLGYDQLEHFPERVFFYMLSRNRSACGVAPYVRATCNPDPDHWLREFMRWWIDETTGLPIAERSGAIRWFVLRDDAPVWADSVEELQAKFGADCYPKSFTFIAGTVFDNPALLSKDPNYLSNLHALQRTDRERLLGGNWDARDHAGSFFSREWFEVVDAAPALEAEIRYWDRAGTEAKPGKELSASWTAGVRMGRSERGLYYVRDVCRFQGSPMRVENTIKTIASQDGLDIRVGIEQDPGQAGKAEAEGQVRNLAGYDARVNAVREAKSIRVRGFSAQAEAGNVKLVRGTWNEAYLRELVNFDGTSTCVSDQVDASSGAFLLLTRAGLPMEVI